MFYKALAFKIIFCASFFVSATATAQSPQSNKPDNKTQVDPVSGTITPPSGYNTGVKVNYLRTKEAIGKFPDETAFNNAAAAADSYTGIKEVTQYMDGLGRPLQTVNRHFSPGTAPKDLIEPFIYDAVGRETHKFLTYVSAASDGNMRLNPFAEQAGFMQQQYPGEQIYFDVTRYEASPLNRVQKTLAPGNSWAGTENATSEKSVRKLYLLNTANDVRVWNITSDALTYSYADDAINIPSSPGFYNAGELLKNITLDETGNATVEYLNKDGLLLLKKVQIGNIAADYSGHSGFLCTYYVYDDFNQIRFVIPPKAVGVLQSNWQLQQATDIINELCFRYEYDERRRNVAKQVPGYGWVYMIYDKRNRLVFSQDGNMRGRQQWHTTLYDGHNRQVATGIIVYTGSYNDLKDHVYQNTGNDVISVQPGANRGPLDLNVNDRSTPYILYSARNSVNFTSGFTTEGSAEFVAYIDAGMGGYGALVTTLDNPIPEGVYFYALTATYYDEHPWNSSPAYNTADRLKLDAGNNPHAEDVPVQPSAQMRGLTTYTRVRVLEDPLDLDKGVWLNTINFYDGKGRLVQSQADNYKGRKNILTNRFDFAGKIICNYLVVDNPAASNVPVRIKTNFEFDHSARLLEVWKTVNDAPAKVLISKNEYDALGQLVKKELGRRRDVHGNYTSAALETLNMNYNIRGWLSSVNKDYVRDLPAGAGSWFGMELSYDWGFTAGQYDGNVAGTKWRSRGDGEQRAFGFSYDNSNRLLGADFTQYDGTAYTDNAQINFDMIMGDGAQAHTAYDENGNIKAMRQWGLRVNGSSIIDDLTYDYLRNGSQNTNKLFTVTESDNIGNTDHKLGDFTDRYRYQLPSADYDYDENGNLITDLNKGVYKYYNIDGAYAPGIVYNHLNLPFEVAVHPENSIGDIIYIYDALGNKLEKRTRQAFYNPIDLIEERYTTTTYIADLVYENDQLQFIGHEEGRMREVTPDNWVFDYFIKDHLRNVRMVLTDEIQKDVYPIASLENANAIGLENDYYNIIQGNVTGKANALDIPDYVNKNLVLDTRNPHIDENANSTSLYRLNGTNENTRMGHGITLKVMAGDVVQILGKSYWKTAGTGIPPGGPGVISVLNLLKDFVGSGLPGGGKNGVTGDNLNSLSDIVSGIGSMLGSQQETPTRPKAYINWILFDENLRPVVSPKHSNSSFDPVDVEGVLKSHLASTGEITKSGYLYIYCSNETKLDVFFDNMQVVHTRGPLLEETHYYPFGLAMAGISSRALKSPYPENKTKFSSQEFNTDLGLDWYQLRYRTQDPQLGRFLQIDPLADKYVYNSTYAYAENKVTAGIDLEGLEFYYSADGKFLKQGPDKNNKEVYVEYSVDFYESVYGLQYRRQESGFTKISDDHDEFLLLASTAYGEASIANVREEMFGIASAIINNKNLQKKGTTITSTIDGYAFAASDGNARKRDFDNDSPEERNGTAKQTAIAGAINALRGGIDYSNGATHWAGDDIDDPAEKRATGGLRFTKPEHDLFGLGDKTKTGAPITEYIKNKNNKVTKTVRGVYSYTWETTAAQSGRLPGGTVTGTTFMRVTNEFVQATGAPRH